jgi:cytochrome c oxidase subunit 1
MNMVSYWLFFLFSKCLFLCLLKLVQHHLQVGQFIRHCFYHIIPGSGMGMTFGLISMALFIASSLMGSLNYVVTVINLRTKGMTMTRLPLTIWAFFVTAIIGVFLFQFTSALLLLIF